MQSLMVPLTIGSGSSGLARGGSDDLLLLLLLSIPVGCLALLSLVAFLGVVALAGALRMIGAIKSGLGLGSADGNQDPWHGMVGDAHPLDYVEGQH